MKCYESNLESSEYILKVRKALPRRVLEKEIRKGINNLIPPAIGRGVYRM